MPSTWWCHRRRASDLDAGERVVGRSASLRRPSTGSPWPRPRTVRSERRRHRGGDCRALASRCATGSSGRSAMTAPVRSRRKYTPSDRPPHRVRTGTPPGIEGRRAEDRDLRGPDHPADIDRVLATDSALAEMTWIVESRGVTDPTKELPEDAVDRDKLVDPRERLRFGKGGAGAGNFLYEAAHAVAAWGQTDDCPQGVRRVRRRTAGSPNLDPENWLPYWNEHPQGGHFPSDGTAWAPRRRPAGVLRRSAMKGALPRVIRRCCRSQAARRL